MDPSPPRIPNYDSINSNSNSKNNSNNNTDNNYNNNPKNSSNSNPKNTAMNNNMEMVDRYQQPAAAAARSLDEEEESVIIHQARRYQPNDDTTATAAAARQEQDKEQDKNKDIINNNDDMEEETFEDDYPIHEEEEEDRHPLRPHNGNDNDNEEEDDDDDEPAMTIQELLYSSSSYYAIAKPVTLTMILAAFCVVFINTDALRQQGQAAMATAYQVWNVQDDSNSSSGSSRTLAYSLANALVMIGVIGTMTFVIVFLYRMRCMKCLIGYMIVCSTSLLGVLGSNLVQNALLIYNIPMDIVTFYGIMFNFATVGVLAVFYGQGIPTIVTQGYLVATSVILAWHLSFFDEWTAWCLLFMLALYDLCAVLSSFGPLRALVEAMSEEDAPEMPGLLFEAHLPNEAQKPGSRRPPPPAAAAASNEENDGDTNDGNDDDEVEDEDTQYSGVRAARKKDEANLMDPSISGLEQPSQSQPQPQQPEYDSKPPARRTNDTTEQHQQPPQSEQQQEQQQGPLITIPLAIAQVYRLPVVAIPTESQPILQPKKTRRNHNKKNNKSKKGLAQSVENGAEPLLTASSNGSGSMGGNGAATVAAGNTSASAVTDNYHSGNGNSPITLPEHPTVVQLRANVTVRMPLQGGRLERVKKRGRRVYLERDRHGQPKRLLWVEHRSGKVFAEVKDGSENGDGDGEQGSGPHNSSIRLGLGDFIFYSVLVSKAAQYSFVSFAACLLVILAGLGGTLLLLAVYHQALPALPISILLGIVMYLCTRWWVEPWTEAVLSHPYYV